MKIDPINFILEKELKVNKVFYFISGNESTLMNKIKDVLLKNMLENGDFVVEQVKNFSFRNNNTSLFGKNKVYLINNLSSIEDSVLEDCLPSNDKYIFFSENSPKINLIKKIFLKRQDSFVFDCYELTKEAKSKIVNKHISINNLALEDGVYWALVDKLDNRFMFLENELNKLFELKDLKIDNNLLDIVVANNSSDIENIFFQIFKSNSQIIDIYNKRINSSKDVNNLFYSIKQLSGLILNYDERVDFEKNIPRYMFREKPFMLDLFSKYNNNKKKALLNLLYKTEKVLRTNSDLSAVIGLRFLLSFKKISTS